MRDETPFRVCSCTARPARALLAALLGVLPTANVRADPTPASTNQCSLGDAQLLTGRDLYAKGNELFELKDYLGAVEAWEQVVLLMPDKVAELRVQLAHAHRRAYVADNDPDHLYSARTLFTAQLESLDTDDPARADIESEIEGVEAELEKLAAAQARAQAERDEAIRQEQIRLNAQALAEAEAEHQRRAQKLYFGIGGSLAGLGAGSLAAMTVFLVDGEKLNQTGWAAAMTTEMSVTDYQDQLKTGTQLNQAALATAVAGGVLFATGTALLITGGVRQGRLDGRHKRVAVSPTPGGVQLRF